MRVNPGIRVFALTDVGPYGRGRQARRKEALRASGPGSPNEWAPRPEPDPKNEFTRVFELAIRPETLSGLHLD